MSMSEAGIRITLNRDKLGVSVNVKTSKLVADFVRRLGDGTQKSVASWGHKWRHPNWEVGEQLYVWDAQAANLGEMGNQVRYRLDAICKNLSFTSEGYGMEVLNLSILRLVGADNPEGVTMLLNGFVASTDALIDLRSRIISASKQLYVDFIRPCAITGVVAPASSQDQLF